MGDLPSATRQSLDWNSSVPKATPFPPCQTSLHFRVCRPEAKGWERERLSAGSSERESAGGQEAARKHPPPRPTASEVGEHADDERHLVTGERAQGSLLGWEPGMAGMAALAARAQPWRSSFLLPLPHLRSLSQSL